jgi:hypothetical protein
MTASRLPASIICIPVQCERCSICRLEVLLAVFVSPVVTPRKEKETMPCFENKHITAADIYKKICFVLSMHTGDAAPHGVGMAMGTHAGIGSESAWHVRRRFEAVPMRGVIVANRSRGCNAQVQCSPRSACCRRPGPAAACRIGCVGGWSWDRYGTVG